MRLFEHNNLFALECGAVLPSIHLAYTTHGELNDSRDNVIWIFHALTANSDPVEWWPGLVGAGRLFDPSQYFIVCVNMPGSCYGSIGPLDLHPRTGLQYLHEFPFFTIRDMIKSYRLLRHHLGIERIFLGAGGSMGGQQLLEWAIEEPELFENIVPLATNAVHSPWAIAFNATQRHAIENDQTWIQRHVDAGKGGMKVAREIALLSYRNYQTYQMGQSEPKPIGIEGFRSESYQRYQGEKLAKRFNAYSYYFLSKSMDSHNVGRGRESAEFALKKIQAKALVLSIESDLLFPPSEQEFLANEIIGASYKAIKSEYGHDGFLLEYEQISQAIRQHLLLNNKKYSDASGKIEAITN